MKSVFVALMLVSSFASAHEGHDHDAPAMVEAPKGGMIKSNEVNHVEVVSKGKDLLIYLYTRDLKPADLSKAKLTATVTLPRAKKGEPLTLTTSGDHFTASYDAKKAHRYTLTLALANEGHEDKFNFTVEPKK